MKEFIEKLIGRLEEISVENTCSDCPYKAKCDEVQEHINDETTDLCGATIKALSIEIVNQLAEEYNNGWIACSERLPDAEADVLLSLRSLDIYTGFRANTEGMFYVEGEGYVEYENVLAWQPLPEPYKPKGE